MAAARSVSGLFGLKRSRGTRLKEQKLARHQAAVGRRNAMLHKRAIARRNVAQVNKIRSSARAGAKSIERPTKASKKNELVQQLAKGKVTRKYMPPVGHKGENPIAGALLKGLDTAYREGRKLYKSKTADVLLGRNDLQSQGYKEARQKTIRGAVKAGGAAVKEVKKDVRLANRTADKNVKKLPGGKYAAKGVHAAGVPILEPIKQVAKASEKGGKALWYSDEVIKATLAGKSLKKILKASQGKEKTSGQVIVKKLGVNAKKHPGAAILLGGAVDFAAQAPVAAATGGSGTVAETAAKQAAQDVFKSEVKAALKKTGAKSFGHLPEAERERILAKAKAAGDNARAHASAKYGRQRELRAGVDVRLPGGRRVNKTVPVTRPVTKTRAAAHRRLDLAEAKGSRTGKVSAKARDAANRANLLVNARAKPRRLSEHEAISLEATARKKRAADAGAERDANNLYEALVAKIDKGQDPRPEMVAIQREIEKYGPDSKDPVARQLHEIQQKAHGELVKRGLAEQYGGQKLTSWDYGKLAKGGRKGTAKLKKREAVARQNVKTVRASGAGKDKPAHQISSVAEADLHVAKRGAEVHTRAKAVHEKEVKRLDTEIQKIDTRLRGYATRPNSAGNVKAVEELKGQRQALVFQRRASKRAAGEASTALKRAERTAEHHRREIAKNNVAAAQDYAKEKALHSKEHAAILKELAAEAPTNNLAETQLMLERYAKRFEKVGDRSTATKLRNYSKRKAEEQKFHTPRVRLTPEKAIKTPPFPRQTLTKPHHRILRKQSATEAAASGRYDFSTQAVVNEVRDRRLKAAGSDYWSEVAKTVKDQGEGHPYYVISPHGISDEQATIQQAASKLKELGGEGRIVRLDANTRRWLNRKGQLHHAEFSPNEVTNTWRRGVGGWKRVAIATPTNYVRNLVGDTTRSVALGGSGAKHTTDAMKLVHAETERQALERSAARFADNVNLSGHRVSTPELDKIMAQTITIGHGKMKEEKTVGDLLDEMSKQGITESGVIRSDVLTGGRHDAEVHKAGKLAGWDRKVSAREMLSRSHLYMNARSAGLSPNDAAEVVRKALIDYGDVSTMEEALRRNLVPFIVFKGRNIATWAGHIVRKPGKLKQYQTIFDTSAQLAGFKSYDDFEQKVGTAAQQLPIPVPKALTKYLGGNALNLSLPIGDLYNTYKQVSDVHSMGTAIGQQVFAARLINDLAPRIVKGKPSSEPSKELPIPTKVGEELLKHPRLVRLFRLSKGPNFDGKTAYFGHPAVLDFLGMTPESGAITRAGSSGSGPWYMPIVNFFTGAGAMTLKPGTGKLQKVRQDLQDLDVQLSNPLPSEDARKNLYKKQAKLKKRRNKLYANQGVPWALKATGRKAPSVSAKGTYIPGKGWQ